MNPRYPFEYAALAKRCFRPLSHLTGGPANSKFGGRAGYSRGSPGTASKFSSRVKTDGPRLPGRGTAFAVLPAMLLPFLSALLLFGSSFTVLIWVMLLSVRAVVVVTGADSDHR